MADNHKLPKELLKGVRSPSAKQIAATAKRLLDKKLSTAERDEVIRTLNTQAYKLKLKGKLPKSFELMRVKPKK